MTVIANYYEEDYEEEYNHLDDYGQDELTRYLAKNGAFTEQIPLPKREPGRYKVYEIVPSKSKCLCCSDTGIVSSNLVKNIVLNYDKLYDKPYLCQCDYCTESIRLIESLSEKEILNKYNLDFPKDPCNEYHKNIKIRQSDPEYLKQQGIEATILLNNLYGNIKS